MSAQRQKKSGQVTIFHDYFAIRGGGERLVLTLANELNCSLTYGFANNNSFPSPDFPKHHKSLDLPAVFQLPGIRQIMLALWFRGQRREAKRHDLRIFSGVSAPFAAPKKNAGGKNIFYCHTPPRFLFDQKRHFLQKIPLFARFFAHPVLMLFEWRYRAAISRMHVIVTNSQNTRRRLKKYMGCDSVVIYPPIETERFVWLGQSDYYLSTARLSPLKRVDKIVEAFMAMPDKKLIIASGGEELEALRSKADGSVNIEFSGWVSDEKLRDLIGNSIASIYLPKDEDFGMSPLESMAAGKPVIGVGEGGLLETIIDGKTGVLLKPDFALDDLITKVRNMTPSKAQSMRKASVERAKNFSREIFLRNIQTLLEQTKKAD